MRWGDRALLCETLRNRIPYAWDLKASLLQGGAERRQALGKGVSWKAHFVMVNFLRQLEWAKRCLHSWYNIIFGSVRVFLEEIRL